MTTNSKIDNEPPLQFSLGAAILMMLGASLLIAANMFWLGAIVILVDILVLDIVAAALMFVAKRSPSLMLTILAGIVIQVAMAASGAGLLFGFIWISKQIF
jgi:hypothetical protein